MKVLITKEDVHNALAFYKANDATIGFVPTMGALHQGHVSLVQRSKSENRITVVSIFVNPTQFNDKKDLKNYPRIPEKDLPLLETCGVDFVFMPTEQEIYPEKDERLFDFGLLDKVMEGEHRPGHFNGVAQVVSKLFDIVKPNKAYFGQKDFQQLAIVKKLVEMMGASIQIISCPIVREPDGLAMSSRNLLLTPDHRKSAVLISQSLFKAKEMYGTYSAEYVTQWVTNNINKDPNLVVEYFQLADAATLVPITNWEDATSIVGCVAVKAGSIRLIDNIIFK